MEKRLEKYELSKLQEFAISMQLDAGGERNELIKRIVSAFKKYEKYKTEKIDKWTKIQQLGNKGKEGTTYLVKDKDGKEYAMKTFRSNKPSDKLREEVKLQEDAAKMGVSPKIIDYDTVSKFVVMEKMDRHLTEEIEKNNNVLSEEYQKQILKIFSSLDRAKVFHGDANLLNYMIKGKKVYIIDFGYGKEINEELYAKLKTRRPNMEIMLLGFILKTRELGYKPESYRLLRESLSAEKRKTYGF